MKRFSLFPSALGRPYRRFGRLPLPALALASLVGGGLAGLTVQASAQSLEEALALAYQNNPELAAARAELEATAEGVPAARANFLPNVTGTGTVNRTHSESESAATDAFGQAFADSQSDTTITRSVQLQVTQPLYRGGRSMAGLRQARLQTDAQRAVLESVEQSVLLDAAVAYLNLARDREVLELRRNNVRVLERQLEASQDRFRVGEITRTDVSQSESRLAGAQAAEVLAEGDLRTSEATFTQVIGLAPQDVDTPVAPMAEVPLDLEVLTGLALQDNPSLLAAQFAAEAAREGVKINFGSLLPELNVVGSVSRSWDPSSFVSEQDSTSVLARLTVPLYQSGNASARVRQSKQVVRQREEQIEQAQRQTLQQATSAWAGLQAARASIDARLAQVEAAEIALEGVRQEAQVGSRTTLDILDAEQEQLDAQVELVRAEHDALIAAYAVLSVAGRLTADYLALDVTRYDPNAYEDRVDWKLWGTSID